MSIYTNLNMKLTALILSMQLVNASPHGNKINLYDQGAKNYKPVRTREFEMLIFAIRGLLSSIYSIFIKIK